MNKIKIPVEYTSSDPSLIRHSDEMQDIISAIPSKLIRWGMFLFFCVFVMMIGLAAFIRFPGKVNTTIMINKKLTAEMPVPQMAGAKIHAGQVVVINFKDNLHGGYKTFKGKITKVSDTLDNNGNFKALVFIEGEGNSGYFKVGMHGYAHILTDNFSILQRIFKNIFD
ncbi:MAG TPA: hypothetical protein VGM63_01590 [Mucilaginibacter sp.]|jgi:hypothetical protein